MAKRKRKVSAATLRNLARGRAKRRANLKRTRTTTRTRTTRKRKAFKVQRRRFTMPKRRRARSRSSGFGGLGKPLNLLTSTGRAFATGFGTAAVMSEVGAQLNIPEISKFANIAGAFAAFSEGKGLPGIIAAFPFISKLTRGVTNGNGVAGSGAFV